MSAPLGEKEGKRAQAEETVGRVQVKALTLHRFQKHSESRRLWQQPGSLYVLKLDNRDACRHTQMTMIRSALALESLTRTRALRLVPGLVILTVIVILPL